MGVHKTASTLPGGLTPICNCCGVSLCWDISQEDYDELPSFWEAWICRDCNGGEPLSRAQARKLAEKSKRERAAL